MQGMRKSAVRSMWILRLVPNIPFGRPLTAVGILALLLGAYAAAGTFEAPTSPGARYAAVFFAVIIAYIVPTYHLIAARCKDAFADLAPHLEASSLEVETWRRSLTQRSARSQLLMAGVGALLGLTHSVALTFRDGLVHRFTSSSADAAVILGTLLVWVVMITIFSGLFQIAALFSRLSHRVRIDLLQPRALTPFTRVAVILTLSIIGAQAAFPLLWLTDDFSALSSIPGLIGTTITMLFLFGMPLLPIHRALASAKAAEIKRVDAEIAASTRARRQDAVDYGRLAPLLAYRREIEAAREWPFDTGSSGRLAFYLLIPPVTWVGAAVIQHFVEGAL